MQTFGAVASRSHPCRPVSASILIWLAGFPTDFLVVGLIGEMVGPNRTSGSLPIADFTVILLDAALAVGKHVAWSGARLSTPCTQLAVNFELATEAINGEFVKG